MQQLRERLRACRGYSEVIRVLGPPSVPSKSPSFWETANRDAARIAASKGGRYRNVISQVKYLNIAATFDLIVNELDGDHFSLLFHEKRSQE